MTIVNDVEMGCCAAVAKRNVKGLKTMTVTRKAAIVVHGVAMSATTRTVLFHTMRLMIVPRACPRFSPSDAYQVSWIASFLGSLNCWVHDDSEKNDKPAKEQQNGTVAGGDNLG